MNWIWVGIGGALGSLIRWRLSILLSNPSAFPWPTFVSNLLASFLLGIFFHQAQKSGQSTLFLLMGTGFCGGFSTFSTFSLEVLKMIETQPFWNSMFYVMASIISTVLFVKLGLVIAQQFSL
jgi:CrcB protein